MNTGKRRFNVIEGNPTPPLRRNLAFATVAAGILLLGAVGGTLSSETSIGAQAQSEYGTPQPAQGFIYFPSQYVNQGVEIAEPIPTF